MLERWNERPGGPNSWNSNVRRFPRRYQWLWAIGYLRHGFTEWFGRYHNNIIRTHYNMYNVYARPTSGPEIPTRRIGAPSSATWDYETTTCTSSSSPGRGPVQRVWLISMKCWTSIGPARGIPICRHLSRTQTQTHVYIYLHTALYLYICVYTHRRRRVHKRTTLPILNSIYHIWTGSNSHIGTHTQTRACSLHLLTIRIYLYI